MTCCVAFRDKFGVTVGGDAMQVGGDGSYSLSRQSKVWSSGMFVCASSGSIRANQVIRYGVRMADHIPEEYGDVTDYLIRDFTLKVREALAGAGYIADAKTPDILLEGGMLICTRKRIFVIHGDLAVTETRRAYEAIGSGAEFAMGSMGTKQTFTPTLQKVKNALRVAERHSAQVRGPFTIMEAA